MHTRLQRRRFEIKYRIREEKAQQIRHFVRTWLEPDPYSKRQPDLSYPVHSLYLDSRPLKTYHDTINGSRNRYKLRIRYYEGEGDRPVCLEIKRRSNMVIVKHRATVHRAAAMRLLQGQLPVPDDLISRTPIQIDALEKFCHLLNQIQARPKVHIRYRREAYEREDSNSVRVTFDRQVQSETRPDMHPDTLFNPTMRNPVSVFGSLRARSAGEVVCSFEVSDVIRPG